MAKPIGNYTQLIAAINSWLNRSDLASAADQFVQLVEADFKRELTTRIQTVATLVTAAGVDTVALPVDVKQLDSLGLVQLNGRPAGMLTPTSPELITYYQGIISDTAQPRYFTVAGNGATLKLAPIPDTVYTLQLTYEAYFTELAGGTGTATNWVLTNHADAYLYGALQHAAPYLLNDERLPIWSGAYVKAKEALRLDAERLLFSGNTPVQRRKRKLG